MGIAPQKTYGQSCAVPTVQIANARQAFPGAHFTYELDFKADEPWQGIAACSDALHAAGLRLKLMRCTGAGLISLRVEDPGEGDLRHLNRWLSDQAAVALRSWTTVLGYTEGQRGNQGLCRAEASAVS